MAQRIVTTCDPHAADNPNDDHHGDTLPPISLDGGVTWLTADLCQPAVKEFVQPLSDLLAEYGRPVSDEDVEAHQQRHRRRTGPTTKGGNPKYPCPRCDVAPMIRSSLRKHLPDEHAWSLSLYEAELGRTLDGHELVARCTECGGGFDHGAGLAAHRRAGRCTPPPAAKTTTTTKRATKRKAT